MCVGGVVMHKGLHGSKPILMNAGASKAHLLMVLEQCLIVVVPVRYAHYGVTCNFHHSSPFA